MKIISLNWVEPFSAANNLLIKKTIKQIGTVKKQQTLNMTTTPGKKKKKLPMKIVSRSK